MRRILGDYLQTRYISLDPITKGETAQVPFKIYNIPSGVAATSVGWSVKAALSDASTTIEKTVTPSLSPTQGVISQALGGAPIEGYFTVGAGDTDTSFPDRLLFDVWVYCDDNTRRQVTTGDMTLTAGVTTFISQVPASVIASPSALNVVEGTVTPCSAVVMNSTGDVLATAPTWSSADESIITVDPVTGVATAVGVGSTTIRAAAGSAFDDIAVTVALNSAVASLTLAPSVATTSGVPVHMGRTFIATARNISGDVIPDAVITIDSITPSTASFDDVTGRMHALAEGAATIRATCGALTADHNFTVTPALALDYLRFSAEDKMTARVINGGFQNGPHDFTGLAYYPKSDTEWAVCPQLLDAGWGASTVVPNGGILLSASGTTEDAYAKTGNNATTKWFERQVHMANWNEVLAHPTGKFYFEFNIKATAAESAATAGHTFRLVISQPGGTNAPGNNFNPFNEPLDPTQGILYEGYMVIPAFSAGYLTVRTREFDVSEYTGPLPTGEFDSASLFMSIIMPTDIGAVTMGIQTTLPHLVAGRLADATGVATQHSTIHNVLGKVALDLGQNAELWSDDFLAPGTTLSAGVTVTPTAILARDSAFDRNPSHLQQVFMPAGQTITRVVDIRDLFVTAGMLTQAKNGKAIALAAVIAPEAIYRHLYVEQDGSHPIPGPSELRVEAVGSLGTYSADYFTHDRFGFMRWKVPTNVDSATLENATTFTMRYRAVVDCHFLCTRSATEPEGSDPSRRNTEFTQFVPAKTGATRVLTSQTEDKVRIAANVVSRNNWTYGGVYIFASNPFLWHDPSDRRMAYYGPAANSYGLDPKITLIGRTVGQPLLSMTWMGGQVSGNEDDRAAVALSLVPADFDTTTIPGYWILRIATRGTARHFDRVYLNRVDVTAECAITYTPANGTGLNDYEIFAQMYEDSDCDNVCSTLAFNPMIFSGRTALPDADILKLFDGMPFSAAA